MPEPRRSLLRQHQRDGVANAAPRAKTHECAPYLVELEARAACGTKKRSPFDCVAESAQVKVGRATFDLAPHEQQKRDRSMIEAAQRAVCIDFKAESRGALE